MYIYVFILTGPLNLWVECSPMARETGVQSQVDSYQRLKKWYLILLCITLSIIRYLFQFQFISIIQFLQSWFGSLLSCTNRSSEHTSGQFYILKISIRQSNRVSVTDYRSSSPTPSLFLVLVRFAFYLHKEV